MLDLIDFNTISYKFKVKYVLKCFSGLGQYFINFLYNCEGSWVIKVHNLPLCVLGLMVVLKEETHL